MPVRNRGSVVLLSAALIAAMGACALPADGGDTLHVQIFAANVLERGDTAQLAAALYAGAVRVSGAELQFETDDPAILQADVTGRVIAVAPGFAWVRAWAAGFAGARRDSLRVKVRDARFDVDAIAPAEVLAGDTLVLSGPGLGGDSVIAVSIGSVAAPVLDRPAGALRVLVPVVGIGASRMDTLVNITVTGLLGTRSPATALRVFAGDRLEPNDSAPRWLGPLSQAVAFPMLAFEGVPATHEYGAHDWYRFLNPATQDVTVTLFTDQLARWDYVAILTRQATPGEFYFGRWYLRFGPAAGTPVLLSHGGILCRGRTANMFGYSIDAVGDARMVIRNLPAGSYDLVVQQDLPQRSAFGYALRVEPGATTELPQDADEDNDMCEQAPVLSPPVLARALTLDHRDDVDWYSLLLPTADSLHVRAVSDSAGVVVQAVWLFDDPPGGDVRLWDDAYDLSSSDVTRRDSFLPAGRYLLMIRGTGATSYRLTVTVGASP